MDGELPPGFQARMEDNTPVTAHNLLDYLAETFYWAGITESFIQSMVGGFLKNTEFRELCEQGDAQAVWLYLFAERNYSKDRMCFIIDLILVYQIFHQFMRPSLTFIRTVQDTYRDVNGDLILCSKVLSMYVDQEKVEICMCLKRYMCYDLWHSIGNHVLGNLQPNERHCILDEYTYWTAKDNETYGGCLERMILGPSKHCFVNMLRNAWTKPDNGYYIACQQLDTDLNRLYPHASLMWEPPRVFKEPRIAAFEVVLV